MKVTKAYLSWRRAGSPGFVWCTTCDCPAGEGHVHVAEDHEAKLVAEKLGYPGEPQTRFINGYYVRGISAKELAWHRSRRPQPVTGSAFALDPTAIHECDDVVAQLQKEEDEQRR
jgi:hypothetical protein